MELTRQENARLEAEERERQKEEAAAEKERMKAEAAAEKERLKEEAAAARAQAREEAAAQRAAEAEERRKKQAVTSVASTAAGTVEGRSATPSAAWWEAVSEKDLAAMSEPSLDGVF